MVKTTKHSEAAKPRDIVPRPPVVAVVGHIDHGKSTLLDYIRKSNVADLEAGGITQQISAYEVTHKDSSGKERGITFIDTPGHAAFSAIRENGVGVADIAILVVSAEDGVKPQTIEAYKCIMKAGIPFVVAINKIDKPAANIDRTKNTLIENEIYLEGMGGTVPFVPISAKTGEGVPDLLDMILLTADVAELTGNPEGTLNATVIETRLDKKKGISAGFVIKDGTLARGTYVVAGTVVSPNRILENFLGKPIESATFSSPVSVIGWSEMPIVGSMVKTFPSKKEAEAYAEEEKRKLGAATAANQTELAGSADGMVVIPVVIKVNVSGVLEALLSEIAKLGTDKVAIRVIQKGIGEISESDVKTANGKPGTIVLGFNAPIDSKAKAFAERLKIPIQTFDVIYKLTEWLQALVIERTPKVQSLEVVGVARIIKLFSQTGNKQVMGGKVEKGVIKSGTTVNIIRRESKIGEGKINELQQQKSRVGEVEEGKEFGTLVESKMEIVPGDRLECVELVEK